jgi:hypothetical protein
MRMAKKKRCLTNYPPGETRAFSSEVDTGSREENASNQNYRAPLLIPSEAERL